MITAYFIKLLLVAVVWAAFVFSVLALIISKIGRK